jgi:hypothetical protein
MLKARHLYLGTKLQETFGVSEEVSTGALRKGFATVNAFLTGEGQAPAHMLAYYQPRDVKNEVRGASRRGPVGPTLWLSTSS